MVAHAHRQKSQRNVSSPGARVETAGAAARNESARKCWQWPARNPADGDGPCVFKLQSRLLAKSLAEDTAVSRWIPVLSVRTSLSSAKIAEIRPTFSFPLAILFWRSIS